MAEGGQVSGAVFKPAKDEGADLAADPLFQTFRVLTPALRRFIANRVRNDADVDDILQDIAARLAARDPEAPVDNKSAFLFSIASNLMKDRDRRRLVRRQGEHVTLDDLEIADPQALQDQVLEGRQRMQLFLAALNTLPAREREVFVAHRMEGQTLLQAAESTGLTLAQVRKLVEQAMARLARKVWKD
ncbi:MAG TPA: sigma-70 family RNA polymerase sigma factor [Hyphomonadaceae bacterium]|jgi:RNA polymerase sigma-70 factor (ECF subfamily)|nr:sigma-70 family RNA polymerase sigma factor [Hyphomonadaceae bacterium]